jgi:phosphoserine phosphatase
VIASSSTHNLSAGRKRDELERLFGKGGYDYAGNSRDDLKVRSSCRKAVVVNASPAVSSQATQAADIEKIFPSNSQPWRALI